MPADGLASQPPRARRLIPFKDWVVWSETVGEGDRTPLLCIPGGPGLAHDYLLPLAALAASRPVIFYDPLGSGRSTRKVPVEWTLALLREEVAAVCAGLGLSRVHIFAHSSGCLVALEAALAYPERFAALVLSSPTPDIPALSRSVREQMRALGPWAVRIIELGEADPKARGGAYLRALLAYQLRHVCRDRARLLDLALMGPTVNVAVNRALKGGIILYTTGALATLDLRPRLAELRHPALVTCGGHDAVTPEMAAETCALLPNAELAVFAQSSHSQHLEDPAAYVAAVSTFLDKVDGSH